MCFLFGKKNWVNNKSVDGMTPDKAFSLGIPKLSFALSKDLGQDKRGVDHLQVDDYHV